MKGCGLGFEVDFRLGSVGMGSKHVFQIAETLCTTSMPTAAGTYELSFMGNQLHNTHPPHKG